MTKAGDRPIASAKEARDLVRYPYTHHGPTIYGSKLADYLVSEASMRVDHPELFEDEKRD